MIDQYIDRIIQEINPSPLCNIAALRTGLAAFFEDSSNKSAVEMEEIAGGISDGRSMHTEGHIVETVRALYPFDIDQLFTAAAIYNKWPGGKVGFAFLPRPRDIELIDYEAAVDELLEAFWQIEDYDPRRILTNTDHDRDFYDSLPERLTIYRGGGGIAPEMLAAGVCWTTSRPIAEWFALRFACLGNEPVVVSARVHKRSLLLAFNSECEVVAWPRKWRRLKCRAKKLTRPAMSWKDEATNAAGTE